MEDRSLEQRVLDLLYAVDDVSQITMCPSIFSDDTEAHDCDECSAGEIKQGDTFDAGVCIDCWKRAIHTAFERVVK